MKYYVLLALGGGTRGVASSREELAELVDANLEPEGPHETLCYEKWPAGGTVPETWDFAYILPDEGLDNLTATGAGVIPDQSLWGQNLLRAQ